MTAHRPADGRDFAAQLRQRRRAAALTQAELASLAGLAVRTVREAERGRTNRPQRTTAVLLADALGLTGEERTGFLGAARGEGSIPIPLPGAAEPPRPPGRPPPAPPLYGRQDELARLAAALTSPDGPRLLSLVGVAGVGKSVLGLAAAARATAEFPAGVATVSCDHDPAPGGLLDAIGTGFGGCGFAELPARLAGRPGLLLLDAVELAGAGVVRKVLEQLPPAVRVLATGRAPVGAPGEQLWPVTTLGVPPAGAGRELAEVADYPAVALFLDRLAKVRPEPPATDEVSALVWLVRRLSGLPLALELAAAHGRLLQISQILRRYGYRVLDLGDRDGAEQTLRAALTGSYRLLEPVEQAALRRLVVFRGRWSVELAEQLLAGSGAGGDPVPLLDRLVTLGLVDARGEGEYRFQLLELVRDLAREQAAARGELTPARHAHAVLITGLAGRLESGLAGPRRRAAAARFDELAGEWWAALHHAANRDPATALRLAAALPRWWRIRGREVAGQQWLRRLLADPRADSAGPTVRAWAELGVARLAGEHSDGAVELAAARRALAGFRRIGDVAGELSAARVLGQVCRVAGRYEDAWEHCAAALAVAVRYRRDRDAGMAQLELAWHELRRGDLTAARRRLAAADRCGGQSGDQRLRLLATAGMAELARLAGRYDEAVATSRRVLPGMAELGASGHRRLVLGTLGQALATLGRCGEAERVLGRLRVGGPPTGATAGTCAAIEARLALARGDRMLAEEWFGAAVAAWQTSSDRRELVEAMAEQAGCVSDQRQRQRLVAELTELCERDGFVLLERERALLA